MKPQLGQNSLSCRLFFKKTGKKSHFCSIFWIVLTKNCVIFGSRSPFKINILGAKGIFRIIVGLLGRKCMTQKFLVKGGIFGRRGDHPIPSPDFATVRIWFGVIVMRNYYFKKKLFCLSKKMRKISKYLIDGLLVGLIKFNSNFLCLSEYIAYLVSNLNKTSRIRAKPWMFRLPFRFYGAAVIT